MKSASSLSVFGRIVLAGALVSVLLLPGTVEAKTATKIVKKNVKTTYAAHLYIKGKVYKDEKVAFENPVSRCNTASMRALHAQMVARAGKDMAGLDVSPSSTSPFVAPAKTYLEGLTVLWSAMEEPYCGYGAFGTSAARHSYEKNANRLQTNFLHDVKKIKSKLGK